MSKKLWLIICEGGTDFDFMSHYHKEHESNIKIKVYSGDFLTKYENNVTNANVVEKITKEFETEVNKLLNSQKVKKDDIEKLIYMTDSDKCFEESTNKSNYLYKLANEESLCIDGNLFGFQVLIMSDNLEHTLYDVDSSRMEPDEKYNLLEKFLDEFKNKCAIDKYLIDEGVYIFEDYRTFKTSIYSMEGRSSNLNTIYENM